ncbi:hypothetical protein GALMADRAFT_62926 [Galerina marginata CBS 339.88]|uniref:non-specific serine/threonine protein kinase n=1 Tax=Galerina marginata (strain CBS 339.88) TaxID=685588 RepID=A0A067THL2_GALM3|nr:hypothetical protein GALMADRAFT_62926 [Galerina marginata CBS 339.88]
MFVTPYLPRRTFSLSKLLRRPHTYSPQKMPNKLQQAALQSFEEEVKATDPKILAASMGGNDQPPEEPLLATFEEGFGYFTDAAVGRSLKQYHFARKLGWAGSSSVWLALDTSAKTRTYVAMKLLTTQATAQVVSGNSPEYDVYRKINAAGAHICFVTDTLSTSLAALRPPEQNRFTVSIAKRITKQILLALDYLHRECGYIHTDLKSENILVDIPQPTAPRIDEYIQSNPASIYGLPLNLKSLSLPLVFSRSQALPYFDLGGTLENISVRLVDYSEATLADNPQRGGSYRQPSILRAPEVTLRYPWSSAIDIWTVGCLLFELLTERQICNQDTENYSHDLHLQYIEEALGPFPLEFLQGCEDRDKYFDKEGDDFEHISIEAILQTLQVVDEGDIPGAAAFMRRCLTLDPKLRPSAQELLKDNWLV